MEETILKNKLDIRDIVIRKYTKELENNKNKTVYDLFKWKKVDIKLMDYKTGKPKFELKDAEFPVDYSQTACDIISEKYFKRNNVPNDRGCEYSLKQVTHRMIKFLVESAIDEKLLTKEEGKIAYDELAYMMLSQMFTFNSPQWFNTGMKYYNTGENSDGHYYYDEKLKKVVRSKDKYSRTQASACFILGIRDKLLGKKSISEQFVTETRLFKHGSGTGTNFSCLRAKGEHLSGGGTSSGVMSFLKGFDANAGTIKSGGTLRRSAKMNQLDIDHPEILDYMKWKAREEQKVRDLGKMGYDTSFEGEAYETVSGQNANNTVRLTNNFMKKVDEYLNKNIDSDFMLRGRVDKSVNRKEKVSTLWNTMVNSAYECADPAPAFDDTFNAWHTCPAGEDGKLGEKQNRINSTNPCGEYAFLDDTACNLASINLIKFYDMDKNIIDIEGYLHCIGLVQLMLESAIHWGQFPTEDIARKSYMFRTTGLGIANLASLLMEMTVPYDSKEARTIASTLMSILTGYSYYISSLMAKRIGSFEKFKINKPYMMKVIKNHARASNVLNDNFEGLTYTPIKLNYEILKNIGHNKLIPIIKNIWQQTINNGEKYGYRNAQVSVIAPTGTISLAMDCGATSIEPFFSHVVYKKLVGGGLIEIINPEIKNALRKLNYTKEQIQAIMDYILRKEKVTENGYTYEKIIDGKLEGCPYLKEKDLPIFDTANKCGTGERYIKPIGHVLMMALLTPMLSGAISKTVNLPKEATKKEISNIFFKAWQLGIKGITVYRDGSKACQPLNSIKEINEKTDFNNMTYKDLVDNCKKLYNQSNKPKRERAEGVRKGTTHPAEVDEIKVYTTVNRRKENNEICEIYITTDREGSTITGLLNSLSKSISVMLQYHVAPVDIANMLKGQQYEPNGFVNRHPYIKYCDSISDLISRIIEIEIGDYSRCQVKPKHIEKNGILENHNINSNQKINNISNKNKKDNSTKVYGKVCPECGSTRMRQNGTCYVCEDCGSTTGCS